MSPLDGVGRALQPRSDTLRPCPHPSWHYFSKPSWNVEQWTCRRCGMTRDLSEMRVMGGLPPRAEREIFAMIAAILIVGGAMIAVLIWSLR